MTDYSEFPPIKYFIRVLKSCPKSALLYIEIWEKIRKGRCGGFLTEKKDIRKEYLISPTMFRNLLAPLAYLNLIQFHETDENYRIDILGPHVNDE